MIRDRHSCRQGRPLLERVIRLGVAIFTTMIDGELNPVPGVAWRKMSSKKPAQRNLIVTIIAGRVWMPEPVPVPGVLMSTR